MNRFSMIEHIFSDSEIDANYDRLKYLSADDIGYYHRMARLNRKSAKALMLLQADMNRNAGQMPHDFYTYIDGEKRTF